MHSSPKKQSKHRAKKLDAQFGFTSRALVVKRQRLIESYHKKNGYTCLPDRGPSLIRRYRARKRYVAKAAASVGLVVMCNTTCSGQGVFGGGAAGATFRMSGTRIVAVADATMVDRKASA
jgi:hypothetical protein